MQRQSSQSHLHHRVHMILSTYQLALFQLPNDLYIYLAALPLSAKASGNPHAGKQSLGCRAEPFSIKPWYWPQLNTEKNNKLKHLFKGKLFFFRVPRQFFLNNTRHPSSTTRFSTTSLADLQSFR